MVGEFNSVSNDPGKQSVSIVNGLYMGMALGEILNAGVRIATMHAGFTSCGVGNQSPSLYGWQNFGSYNLFADGLPTRRAVPGCPNAQPTAFGTPFPNARAYQLASLFARPGEHMLATSLDQVPSVRAYAVTQGSGYALLLFNLDANNPVTATIAVGNQPQTSFTGQACVYDKTIYDLSRNNTWAGPSCNSLGTLTNPFPITLTPWSMTVVQLTGLAAKLTLSLNQTTFRPGTTLRLGLGAQNPGPAFNADFYLGVLLPDGVTLFLFTQLSPPDGVVTRVDADPRTFQLLAANVLLPAGLDITLTDLLVFTFLEHELPGRYVVFAVLTEPNAFSDGRIDTGDILLLAVQSFTFSP